MGYSDDRPGRCVCICDADGRILYADLRHIVRRRKRKRWWRRAAFYAGRMNADGRGEGKA